MSERKRRRGGESATEAGASAAGRIARARRERAAGSVVATKIRAAESAFADLRQRITEAGGSEPGSAAWTLGGESRLEIGQRELDSIGRLLAEARGASWALASSWQTVDEVVLTVVAQWAGLDGPTDALPGSNSLCDLLRSRGIECNDEAFAILVGRLQEAFPGALADLRAKDLAPKGTFSTVDKLLDFVAGRV
jgi:hypothetical protein